MAFIMHQRRSNTFTNDDDLEIYEVEDYYTFNFTLWRFLFEIYGGGPTIKIRYSKK
jgi:hypothetical protein